MHVTKLILYAEYADCARILRDYKDFCAVLASIFVKDGCCKVIKHAD